LCAFCDEAAIARLPSFRPIKSRPDRTSVRWTPVCYHHSWPQNRPDAPIAAPAPMRWGQQANPTQPHLYWWPGETADRILRDMDQSSCGVVGCGKPIDDLIHSSPDPSLAPGPGRPWHHGASVPEMLLPVPPDLANDCMELCAFCDEAAIARLPSFRPIKSRPDRTSVRWTPVCYHHSPRRLDLLHNRKRTREACGDPSV
jgi:hypothetical protein